MVIYERPVRFEDVDAAGLVFFARFFGYCHEAMERLFDLGAVGYVSLIRDRKVGFPAVHVEADYAAPLRYGDTARIELSVVRIGTTSATLRYVLSRVSDRAHVATVEHVVVACGLERVGKLPLPDDCRAALEAHLESS